mmetsp:Transcript_27236/g.69422  ORF Transcript_27236/g.69422 Transcript_27236/m.69422 type:complete len:317 (-) Transcript_27236:711-1661(-)
MADGFEQPLAARLAHPPLAHSGEHQIKRLAREAVGLLLNQPALRLVLRRRRADLEDNREHHWQVVVQHRRPGLPIDVLGPHDVRRQRRKVAHPRQVEAERDLAARRLAQVEPQRIGRTAVEVRPLLVRPPRAVDVVEARHTPRDRKEVDVREKDDERLDASVEPPLVEVAERSHVLAVEHRHGRALHLRRVPPGRVEADIARLAPAVVNLEEEPEHRPADEDAEADHGERDHDGNAEEHERDVLVSKEEKDRIARALKAGRVVGSRGESVLERRRHRQAGDGLLRCARGAAGRSWLERIAPWLGLECGLLDPRQAR